ncbi:alpha-(1,3)-fucosyltransferase C-like [Palaemon carinicauda]|uniref:alpha-(1,3)-fucosyltransferase C-like n=1 Tax=Palaemon carinicauda TaxID=392227 RepID=UPI0035B5AE67
MNAEPPGHVKRLQNHRKRFNWTLTYRLDSDISMRIGQIIPTKNGPKEDNSHINYADGKNKMAAWFVSNCGTDSGRSKITKQLQKYFPVDVYGKCGPLRCPRFTKVDCYKKAERQYKFYLSFENSLCKDYVTEKFFKVLLYNMVPVVYGGADYKAIAPTKSYINVRDFPTIKALADYLLYLNSNDTAYNEYFRWKRHYDVLAVSGSKNLAWCDLCKKLHTDSKHSVYPNIRDWFIKQARCQTTKSKTIRNFVDGL